VKVPLKRRDFHRMRNRVDSTDSKPLFYLSERAPPVEERKLLVFINSTPIHRFIPIGLSWNLKWHFRFGSGGCQIGLLRRFTKPIAAIHEPVISKYDGFVLFCPKISSCHCCS